MSLEDKIVALGAQLEANTAAQLALATAWNELRTTAMQHVAAGGSAGATAAGVTMDKAPAVGKPEKAEKKAAAPAPSPAAEVKAATTEAATASPSDEAGEVTLEQLQAAVVVKAKTDREAVVAVLTSFGAKRASEVPADKRAECLAAIEGKAVAEDLS